MNTRTKPAVTLLILCAVVDLAAVPALLIASGADRPPTVVGIAAGVLGTLTAVAALGIARGVHGAGPFAVGTRAIDVLVALPGLGAGAAPAVAVTILAVLSVAAIVFIVRGRRMSADVNATAAPARVH